MREDIQALRGWAVTLVVLNHAGLGYFHSGFLGVDVFFVISGFLITGHLAKSISDGTFSFREFYFKRARRILPAAYATIILTCFGSIWFLSSTESEPLRDQVLGAVGFAINFVLWRQTDYFGAEANLKPLLHMWSLAIEEQFYIVLPVVMIALPARLWKVSITAISAASIALCLAWVRYDPAGAFYLLPTRAWELAIGSIGALLCARSSSARVVAGAMFWPAILVLIVVPMVAIDLPHPGVQALAVCAATLVVILARDERIGKSLPVRGLARIGDVSYSLYLVHWPVMVFAYAATLGQPSLAISIGTIAVSIALAVALYTLVEQPVRKGFNRPTLRFGAITAFAALLTVGSFFASASAAKTEVDFAAVRALNYGLDKRCNFAKHSFEPLAECQTSSSPKVLVWGDSYAMHLVPGLIEISVKDITQATFSACAPFLGIAPNRDMADGEAWADRCLAFNRDVLRYLADTPSIEVVVLGSPWRLYVDGKSTVWDDTSGTKVASTAGADFAFERLSKTIEAIQSLGRKVVMFTPPPRAGTDTSSCIERLITGRVLFHKTDCSIDATQALRADAAVYDLAEKLKARYDVQVVRIADALCDGAVCETAINGTPVYRDGGHLSYAGSEAVMRRLGLKAILPE